MDGVTIVERHPTHEKSKFSNRIFINGEKVWYEVHLKADIVGKDTVNLIVDNVASGLRQISLHNTLYAPDLKTKQSR